MAVTPSPGLLPVSDRVDLVQSTPPVSLPGMARIAMIAGVPSVSINGGTYASFGTGGAAPTGVKLPFSRLIPSDRLDIIQGNPPVSPLGLGRLACIAGAPSVSIEGAAYTSLGAAGSAPTRGPFPGFLPTTDYIDLIQGNPPVSNPGTARIACFPGSSNLSISVEGGAYVALGVAAPPGSPSLWFDAQNVDGLNNSTMIDGQQVGTWKNLGSLASADLVQATGALRPLFRLVATAGKINNKSAVQSDGTQFMRTGAVASLNQPNLVAVVFRSTSLAAITAILDANSAGRQMFSFNGSGSGVVNMFAGVGPTSTGLTIVNLTWETLMGTFNGATSNGRLNGVDGGTINVGTNVMGGLSAFSDNVTDIFAGFIEEILVYSGSLPSAASVDAYINAKIGANPQ